MHYVGIDVAAARPSDIAVLNESLECVEAFTSSDATVTAARLSRSYAQAIIAIDAPRWLNQRLMADEGFRERLNPPPNPGKHLDCRVCDYELSHRNVALYFTPHQNPPPWMQVGFRWFCSIIKAGFADYGLQQEAGERCVIEYYPYASFVALLGGKPAQKTTALGRKQRVELLRGMAIHCDYGLMTTDMIDALVGAVTACRFHQGTAEDYGDPTEGLLTVAAKLPDRATPLQRPGG